MGNLILKGKIGNRGYVEGEAFVVRQSFGFWGTVDQHRGLITDRWNEARGKSFIGKILVVPSTKGSSANWVMLRLCGRLHTNPKAILSNRGDPLIVGASIEIGIPYMYDFDKDLLSEIETGDTIKADANNGIVEIVKK
jgi:predicted aconitase with swiveling domain